MVFFIIIWYDLVSYNKAERPRLVYVYFFLVFQTLLANKISMQVTFVS